MTVQNIYKRLAAIGYSKKYLQKRILPEWWDDEIAQTQSGMMEMALYLVRYLGLDLHSILNNEATIQLKPVHQNIKFKQTQAAQLNNATNLQGLVYHIGTLLNQSFKTPFNPTALNAQNIRNKILTENEYVALPQLLAFCASIGIPVIHLTDFPFNGIDGLTLKVEGRPVIIVTNKKQKFSGWLAFIIAHELGHIACGHLENTDLLVDAKISGNDNQEQEEKEANDFASELLTGQSELRFTAPYRLRGDLLAKVAIKTAQKHQMDPSIVALNYTWNEGLWGAGINALKVLEPNANAPQIINQFLMSCLKVERLGDHELSYLEQMTDIEMEEYKLV